MIFPKKLENAIKQVKAGLPKDELFSGKRLPDQDKLDILMEIVQYVKKMDYIKSQSVKEKFAIFLRSKYNYETTGAKFNKKRNTIEVMVMRVSNQLESLVGKETIEMILDGKVSEAMKIFRTGTVNEPSLSYFLPDILKFLPEPKFEMFYSLEECKAELNILGLLTRHGSKQFLENYDQRKLAHILYILSLNPKRLGADIGDTMQGYFDEGHTSHIKITDERDALIRFFNGEFDSSENSDSVRMKDQVDKAIQMIQSQNVFHDAGSELDYSSFGEG
jgi:hypothetical protein